MKQWESNQQRQREKHIRNTQKKATPEVGKIWASQLRVRCKRSKKDTQTIPRTMRCPLRALLALCPTGHVSVATRAGEKSHWRPHPDLRTNTSGPHPQTHTHIHTYTRRTASSPLRLESESPPPAGTGIWVSTWVDKQESPNTRGKVTQAANSHRRINP